MNALPGPAASPFVYSGPPELQQAVADALRAVVDPEMALSILDVGLVHGVSIANNKCHVTVTMTSVACPVTEVILADIENELDRVMPADLTIAVELVWEPAWTPERMSPQAKAFMGW